MIIDEVQVSMICGLMFGIELSNDGNDTVLVLDFFIFRVVVFLVQEI